MHVQHSFSTVDSCYQIYKNSSNEKILFKIMNYSFFFYKNFLSLLLFFQTICHTDIDKYSYIDFEKISFVRYYFYRLFTGSCNNSSGNSFIFISLFVQSVWKSSNFNKRRNIADLYNGVTGHVCILLV